MLFILHFCLFVSPQISFDLAEYTADVDGIGTLRLLDAIKTCGLINSVKFYQASTSELYGKVQEIPQKETTPFYPRSPYGRCINLLDRFKRTLKVGCNITDCEITIHIRHVTCGYSNLKI